MTTEQELAWLALDYVKKAGLGWHFQITEKPDLTRRQFDKLTETEFSPSRDALHNHLFEYLNYAAENE